MAHVQTGLVEVNEHDPSCLDVEVTVTADTGAQATGWLTVANDDGEGWEPIGSMYESFRDERIIDLLKEMNYFETVQKIIRLADQAADEADI